MSGLVLRSALMAGALLLAACGGGDPTLVADNEGSVSSADSGDSESASSFDDPDTAGSEQLDSPSDALADNEIGDDTPLDSPEEAALNLRAVEGPWKLRQLVVDGDMAIPLAEASDAQTSTTAPTMRIDGSSVTGDTGCNSFEGSVAYDADSNFDATEVGITKRACVGEVAVSEKFFSESLDAVTNWRTGFGPTDEPLLILSTADEQTAMTFAFDAAGLGPDDTLVPQTVPTG